MGQTTRTGERDAQLRGFVLEPHRSVYLAGWRDGNSGSARLSDDTAYLRGWKDGAAARR